MAVIAAAAAAVGPVYFAAASASVMQDMVHGAPSLGKGIDVTRQGGLAANSLANLASDVRRVASAVPSSGAAFGRPIDAVEFSGHLAAEPQGTTTVVAWRDGLCQHVAFVSGMCPAQRDQVAVSQAMARQMRLTLGQQIEANLQDSQGRPVSLAVVGVYQVSEPNSQYWFARPYFAVSTHDDVGDYTDAVFTPQSTFASAAPFSQSADVIDLPLNLDNLEYASTDAISGLVARLTAQVADAEVSTTLPAVLAQASTSQQALAAPVFLVTAQLLVLCWLLLFLLVTEAAEARGNEVALAKLRGLTRRQTILFGLSEQVVLLVLALPLGALVGWLATKVLTVAILRAGTPVPLVGLGWAAAAVAVAGGAIAAVAAARRTLSRSVLAQWSHTASAARSRGWVMDAVIAVLAVAAIVELFVSGVLGNASHNPLALLAPGLIALTIALLSSRALPLLSKAFVSRTARHGGLGGFLAARQITRRPGAARTTVALTTAFGLVTFTIAAWSVVNGNIHDVAWTEVGASQVLTVSAPPGVQLNTVVDKLDPSGANAVTVDMDTSTDPNTSEVRTLLAVDPQRFAKVAYWRNDFSTSSLTSMANQLDPSEPAPVLLKGDQVSVAVNLVIASGAASAELYAEVEGFQASGFTPVDLGPISSGSGTLTASLPNCAPYACTLRELYVEPQNPFGVKGTGGLPFAGEFTLSGITVHDATGWHPVKAGLGEQGRWSAQSMGAYDTNELQLGAGVVNDRFQEYGQSSTSPADALLAPIDKPAVLPAIVTGSVDTGGGSTINTHGLDDNLSLYVKPVGLASALPGAGGNGLIVDRAYAELASTGLASDVSTQVWLAPTAPADFVNRLRAAGVTVLSSTAATDAAGTYSRQGPALALALFLADAVAAAILAAGGAVLGMHLAGRRRSYEMAALVATGARKRSLGSGLLIEQGVTLGFGAILGIGAGLLATVLAVPSIPEFVNLPFNGAAPLRYHPSASQLSTFLGIAIVLLAVSALTSAAMLIRSVRPDQLREAAP